MASRTNRFTVEAVFRAVNQMTGPMRMMSRQLKTFTDRAYGGFRDLGRMVDTFRSGFLALGVAITAVAAGAVAALRSIIQTGVDFEQTITEAGAKFGGIRQGTEEFERLREAAEEVGGATEFSATQTAEALTFMAEAGFTAEQAIAALPGVVDLATAAQIDIAEATSIAAESLGQFGLMTSDAAQLGTNLTRVNDVLARASTATNSTVQELAEAFSTVGPVANAAGASIETTAGLIGTLANAGIKGSEAGTALRAVFNRLTGPVGRASRLIRRLGIDTRDSEGNLLDINNIIGQVAEATRDMGTAERGAALKTLFGEEAVAGANVLLQAGTENLDTFRTSLEQAGGASAEMAAIMRDTTQGSIAEFDSAIEDVQLQVYEVIRGPFREILVAITDWIRANRDLISSGLTDTVKWLEEHSWAVVAVLTAIALILAAIAAVALIVAVTAVIMMIPFLLFWAIVIGLIALFDYLSDVVPPILDEIGAAMMGVWDEISGAFSAAADYIGGILTEIGDYFVGLWENTIRPAGMAVLEFLVGIWVMASNAVRIAFIDPTMENIEMLTDFFMSVWEPVSDTFVELWGTISSIFMTGWALILSGVQAAVARVRAIWSPVGGFFTSIWEGVRDTAYSVWQGIVDRITAVVDTIKAIWAPIAEGFASLWNSIVESFTAAFSTVVDTIGGIVNFVRGVGREELSGGEGEGAQMVSPQERTARSISETTTTERADVTIRDQTGRAEVTRRPQGRMVNLRLQRTGAL